MAKIGKSVTNYLENIGADDSSNVFLIDEFEFNESIGKMLKFEIKKMAKIGVMNEKGKLNQLILGYQKYVQIKIAL